MLLFLRFLLLDFLEVNLLALRLDLLSKFPTRLPALCTEEVSVVLLIETELL